MSATAWAAWVALALVTVLFAAGVFLVGYALRAWRELAPSVLPLLQTFGFSRQRAAVPPLPPTETEF